MAPEFFCFRYVSVTNDAQVCVGAVSCWRLESWANLSPLAGGGDDVEELLAECANHRAYSPRPTSASGHRPDATRTSPRTATTRQPHKPPAFFWLNLYSVNSVQAVVASVGVAVVTGQQDERPADRQREPWRRRTHRIPCFGRSVADLLLSKRKACTLLLDNNRSEPWPNATFNRARWR